MFRRAPILSLVTIVSLAAGVTASAAEVVTVQLTSGRTFTREIDPRSSDTALWLRQTGEGVTIARPIAWERIEQAEHNGQPIAIDELKVLAKEVAAAAPAAPAAAPEEPRVTEVLPSPAPPLMFVRPPIRSLSIDAAYANFDADADVDGLAVTIYPLDRERLLTPVDGSLQVEVFAPEVRRFQDAPHGRGLTLERLATWTVAVHAADFGPSGLRVELPYDITRHPEYETRILPHGVLRARLAVPGDGVFHASAEFVRLRPWSPLRDQLWRDTGRRALP